jgi:hypothetical protein
MTQIIDTYELLPMQAGMPFDAVSAGRSGVDVEQVVATFHEPLDEALFLRASQRMADTPFCDARHSPEVFWKLLNRNLKGAANGYETD